MEFLSVREFSKSPKAALTKLALDGKAVLTNNGKPSAILVKTDGPRFEKTLALLQKLEFMQNVTEMQLQCIIIVLASACAPKREKTLEAEDNPRSLLNYLKYLEPLSPEITGEERHRQLELYLAMNKMDEDAVRDWLDKGADPDRCLGGFGWVTNNPLRVLVRNFYNTYVRIRRGEEIPDPTPDVAMLQVLVDGGADINRDPYVWQRVFIRGKMDADRILSQPEDNWMQMTPEEAKAEMASYVKDNNRLIEALIGAGADPDKRGHPTPYRDREYANITDEEAAVFFAQGTRPINEAIKKGMVWESQVDLLLQYTKLDEDSLEAARESNDPGMVEKIIKIWNEK